MVSTVARRSNTLPLCGAVGDTSRRRLERLPPRLSQSQPLEPDQLAHTQPEGLARVLLDDRAEQDVSRVGVPELSAGRTDQLQAVHEQAHLLLTRPALARIGIDRRDVRWHRRVLSEAGAMREQLLNRDHARADAVALELRDEMRRDVLLDRIA
jgi:hypothetical protein